jgi:hypothetical protein
MRRAAECTRKRDNTGCNIPGPDDVELLNAAATPGARDDHDALASLRRCSSACRPRSNRISVL